MMETWSSGQWKSEDLVPLLGRLTLFFQMVLHLPLFPARAGLGKSRHADFVILRVNTLGKNKSLCKAASCLCNRALDQPGSQRLLASRGQWSIWVFPLLPEPPGEGAREPPALALSQPVSSRFPGKRSRRRSGSHSFVSPPASALMPSSASGSSSRLIMSREARHAGRREREGLRESNHRHSDGK